MVNTHPALSTREHVTNLVNHLKRYFPDLEHESLLFFDQKRCIRGGEDQHIKKDDLMSYDQFKVFIEQLCDEGREWINLSGDSWFQDKFLISVEYSWSAGKHITAVVLSGPTLDTANKPLPYTRLKII